MTKSDLLYIICDYCSQYEIDTTELQLNEAVEAIAGEVEYWEEYNIRCGIHSVNMNLILDRYFEEV